MRKILLFLGALLFGVFMLHAQQIQPSAIQQINSLEQEKESRSPAQRKMDSQLWYALKMERGQAITNDVPTLLVNVRKASDGKVPVEISGNITPALLSSITNAGGEIIFSSQKFQSVTAKIPLLNLEQVAGSKDVKFIAQSLPPKHVGKPNGDINSTNTGLMFTSTATPLKMSTLSFEQRKENLKRQLLKALQYKPFIGAVTSEGDVTHKANLARTTFSVNGAGIKIGVLSDSYNSTGGAPANVASGDLPGPGNPNGFLTPVTVLQDITGGSDEGRAMLQIVHDLAPGAQLFFATADVGGQAGFAQNIINLRAAGCDIICDDVFYYAESVFQDGTVAQAVNTVTASGALYFSSAGNQGNKDDNTSTVWEGDFVDGGSIALITGGTVNDFGGGTLNNQILSNGGVLKLTWADPLGASTNDYDIYVLNSAASAIVASGTNVQSGTQDPIELINGQAAGNRVVIFKKTAAAARALHLNGFNEGTNGFAITTQGQTSGHSSAAAAFSVAATPAAANPFGGPAGPYPGPFVATNLVQTFSSDGPRRVFLNADGSPITPGNFLFATNGGTVRQKPDITAANGVSTSGFAASSGLNPFFGTSAAAPHAAAIAALLKQYTPSLTPAQVRTILTSTAIDIQAPGVDRDAGAGIVMALEALQGSCVPGIGTQPSNTTVCAGTTAAFSITATGNPPITYQWQVSTDNGATWTNIPAATASTYSFTAVAGDNGKQFRCVATGSCGFVTSNAAVLTITTLSQGGTINPATSNACQGTNSTTLTLTGSIGNVIRWESSIDGGTTWVNIANTTTSLTATNITQTTLYRALVQSSGCSAAYSATATINFVSPGVGNLVITADNGTTLCAGTPDLLTALSATPGSVSVASGPITVGIPDNTPAGVSTPLTVSGVPAAAVGTSASVTFNITHTWDGDLTLFIKAPNNNVLNLVNQEGSLNDNFVNTVISSTATVPVSAGSAPFTGTFLPDASLSAPAPTGFAPLVSSFAPLYSTAGQINGTWLFGARDNAGGDVGTITSWGLTINYNILANNPGLTYVWSPAAGLNATNINPVAASPGVSTTYTVVATAPTGCTGTASIAITVNQLPKVTAQPVNVSVCDKSTATFTVAGTGTSIAYQWQVSTNGGTSYTDIANGGAYSGATTTTLTINPVSFATMNNNLYRCNISGVCTPVASSVGAKLTVVALPNVTVTPNAGCGGVQGINGLTLTASGANTYVWTPTAGLFTDPTTTIAYTGTNLATVYAAPTVFTTYTVSGTSSTTGCTGSAVALVNYTPPAPTVTPASVLMCLGDPAVKLKSSSSTTTTLSFPSGTIHIPIADADPAGTPPTSLTVSGVPANATISKVEVLLNVTHTYIADMSFNLKAPNGQILNLDRNMGATGNPGANFVNTVISSAGTASLSGGTAPYTATFKADIINGTITPGYTYGDPTGYVANAPNWAALYSVPNGTWTLASADDGAGDFGFIENWTLKITYVLGVPATPAVWTPVAGLYSDAAATVPYVAGTAVDSVWARPTPSGVYPYQATVKSLSPVPPPISTNFTPGNGNYVITFNFRNNNLYPVNITDISSLAFAAGASNVEAWYSTTSTSGSPGAIAGPTWTKFGSATINATGGTTVDPFMSGLNLSVAPGQTIRLLVGCQTTAGGFNMGYSTLAGGVFTFSSGGCDIVTGDNIGYGGGAIPSIPGNTPRGFVGSVGFAATGISSCTSPPRTVVVTVNQPIAFTTQPVDQVICTNKVASFTAVATGSSIAHNWRVSVNNGNTWTDVSNGGVYAGANTTTLTITAPPVSMNGYLYKDSVSTTPCPSKSSNIVKLTVNPLPTIIISASPYQKLFPGLKTTIFSTVSPAAATYTWLKNGITVPNATASSLVVTIDGMGTYSLLVTDVNGCTNTSNSVLISDSTSGRVFIYPTPNAGQFQVRYNTTTSGINPPRGLNIYDAVGKRVLTQTYPIGAPYARMDVDMRNLSTGVYWVEVVDVSGNRLAIGRTEVLR